MSATTKTAARYSAETATEGTLYCTMSGTVLGSNLRRIAKLLQEGSLIVGKTGGIYLKAHKEAGSVEFKAQGDAKTVYRWNQEILVALGFGETQKERKATLADVVKHGEAALPEDARKGRYLRSSSPKAKPAKAAPKAKPAKAASKERRPTFKPAPAPEALGLDASCDLDHLSGSELRDVAGAVALRDYEALAAWIHGVATSHGYVLASEIKPAPVPAPKAAVATIEDALAVLRAAGLSSVSLA